MSVLARTIQVSEQTIKQAVSDIAQYHKRQLQDDVRERVVKAIVLGLHTGSLERLFVWVWWLIEIKWK